MHTTTSRPRLAITATLAAVGLAALTACGPETTVPGASAPAAAPGQSTPAPWVNRAPEVLVASPHAMAVGETVTVLGRDFIAPEHGRALLHLRGRFYDDAGAAHPVDLSLTPRWVSPSKLSWKLWPDVVFHPDGDRLGRFVGHVVVTNVGADGSQRPSRPRPFKVDIEPSLIVRVARPRGGGCAPRVDGTTEGQPFEMTVEAVGLRRPSADNPLTFRWTLLHQQWELTFSAINTDVTSVLPKEGGVTIEQRVDDGLRSSLSDRSQRAFVIKVGAQLLGDGRLDKLRTRPVAAGHGSYFATVGVVAIDAAGRSARLALPIEVHRQAELVYNGATRVAERFAPQLVTDCIPGGDIGRQISYREDKSESRSRSMSFNYNASVGLNLGLPSNPFALGVNFNAGFGVDVNASVSSSQSKALDISGQILPGQHAVFYRQTTKVVRAGQLVGHTRCGQSVNLGEVLLTDWIFTPELAHGASCPPPSKLPAAGRFER